MMSIREINNKKLWEDFLLEANPSAFFQSWNWGETIKKVKSQKSKVKSPVWRLGVFDEGNLVGIAQVVGVDARRGRFIHVRHGPVLLRWEKKYFSVLLEYLRTLSGRVKAVFMRISPLIDNSPENRDFVKKYHFRAAPIHAMDGEYVWVLDLNKTENELLSGMRKTTRSLIKQAINLGIEITLGQSQEELDKFLELYKQTAQRQGFIPHLGIEEEYQILSKENQAILLLGKYQGEILSGAIIVFYGNQGIYHHSASFKQKVPINQLLQWRAIQEAKRRGMKLYNFWGVAPLDKKRHPWQGLSLFKRGFGGHLVEYLHAQDLPLSSSYGVNWLVETVRRIRKGY